MGWKAWNIKNKGQVVKSVILIIFYEHFRLNK